MKKLIYAFMALSLIGVVPVYANTKTPAKDITVDTDDFGNAISKSADTVQKALQEVNDNGTGGGGGGQPGGSQGQYQYNNGGNFTGGAQLYTNGTNIGIGTGNPGKTLDVAGPIRSTSGGYFFPDGTSQTTAATSTPPAGSATELQYRNGGAFGAITGSAVAGTGNVGIGSLAPTTKLDVGGTARMTGFQMTTTPTSGYVLTTNSAGIGTWMPSTGNPGGSTTQIQYNNAGSFAGNPLFVFDGTNVGLGTALAPALLTVNGQAQFGNVSTNSTSLTTNSSGYFGIVPTGGRTGIGTFAPNSTLDVRGTAVVTGFKLTTTPTSGYVLTSDTFGVGTWAPVSASTTPGGSNPQLQFNSSGSFAGVSGSGVDSNGNVGLGTTLPPRKLEVVAADTGTTLTTASAASIGIENSDTTTNNFSDLAFSTLDSNGALSLGSKISGVFTSHTAGSVSGDMVFLTKNAGTTTEKVRLTSSGNLGVGTITPVNKLGVGGSVAIGSGYAGVTAAPTNGLIVQGNVGVGSTAPGQALDVTGTIRASTDLKVGTKSTCLSDGTNCPPSVGTNYWSLVNAAGNVGISTSNTVGIGTTLGSAALTVMNGNVGIGTWNPVQALQVVGTTQMTGFKLTTSPSSGYVLTSDSAGVGTWQPSTGGGGTITSGTTNRFTRYTGATTLDSSTLNADDGTNVGIGTIAPRTAVELGIQALNVVGSNIGIGTVVPSSALQVNQSGNTITNGITIADSTKTALFRLWDDGTNGRISTGSSDGANVYMVATGTGNVGIGTSTIPLGAKLIISGAPGTTANIALAIANRNGKTYTVGSLGSAATTVPNGFTIFDGSVFRWVIDGNGNVGIGTTLPSSLLEVGVRKLNVTTAGNVGIGTINPPDALYTVGTINATTGYKSTGSTGLTATCGGTAVQSITIVGGIVTACTGT